MNGLIEQWAVGKTGSSGGVDFNLLIQFADTNYTAFPFMIYGSDPNASGIKNDRTVSKLRVGIDADVANITVGFRAFGF